MIILKLPFYKLRRGIHNIIRYIPVIWDDEDFSYEPLYKLMYYKLKFMEDFHRSRYTWAANSDETADEIRIAKVLAKRLWQDDYLTNATIEYDKKWKNEKLFNFVPKNNGKRYRLEHRNEEQHKDFSKASKHSDYMENQDREYLFDYICKRVRNWWD
ncbi:hypothetical protein [Clostridium sp.]|uniref:hypothetical protein n=1 Tax=Clostridium sp. TaxID=1506 RepID=UPI0026272C3B|nr:hypothetical protein [Clostridium sp.]